MRGLWAKILGIRVQDFRVRRYASASWAFIWGFVAGFALAALLFV